MRAFHQGLRLGIVGGGQLGRMLIQGAIDLNLEISVLDPSDQAPAKPYAHHFTQGSLTDFDTVYAFGKDLDVLTIEIENVNADALAKLQQEGKTVYPEPAIIKLIQDKREQKQFFEEMGLPTAPFKLVDDKNEAKELVDFLPAVNKLGRAGYDGRGVQIIQSEEDLEEAFDAPGIMESLIDFEKELAVIVARNPQGDTVVYPVVEMVFHPEQNLVEYLYAPADIPISVSLEAQALGRTVVEKLSYVGLMAIELFLTRKGEILINELAPRPHNSGHHTIRANFTSQYEQHLRAILDLPLGATDQQVPAAMVNMLGAAGHSGTAVYDGMEDILKIPGVYPHIYGKMDTRPFRKMGHITVLDQDLQSLKRKAQQVLDRVRVIAAELQNQVE
ncbi:MAG: 5-(carboxyamino)imidazole ribonucleotide synthase [Bacteroidota bacterium]